MTLAVSTEHDFLEAARAFAALSGPFRPQDALQAAIELDPKGLAVTASRLAADCDTALPDREGLWLMRLPARRRVLRRLKDEGRLEAAMAARAARPETVDEETQALLEALAGRDAGSPAALSKVIEAARDLEGPPAGGGERLAQAILALDRAGELAPARELLDPARMAFGALERRGREARFQAGGFHGRGEEIRQLLAWLERPPRGRVLCWFLTGAPGIGKSSLLQKTTLEFGARQPQAPIVVRLDCDRAGLDVLDPLGLTMEIARQVAEQVGGERVKALLAERLEARSSTAGPSSLSEAAGSWRPEALARVLAGTVADTGRPVVVLLDTLEVLRGRGESHPPALFAYLDWLAGRGLEPLRVLAAGRSDALDSCLDRIGDDGNAHTYLGGLVPEEARPFLAELGVPEAAVPLVLEVADGNPLKLRLAGEIARRADFAEVVQKKRSTRKAVTSAFLYRFLLSRIHDEDLRKIAHPGLVVRRVSADLIREVLAPALRLGAVSPQRAEQLLDELAAQHWLLEPDPGAPGFLRHRGDVRALLLPLLYEDDPKRCARVDEKAAAWFAGRPEPWAQVEAAYHRLQLTRAGRDLPHVDPGVAAQFDEQMLEELPFKARDHVLAVRGDRTTLFREGSRSATQAELAREAVGLVKGGDWRETHFVIARVARDGGVDPRGEGGDALRALLWRTGRWEEARRALADHDLYLGPGDPDLGEETHPDFLLVRLEMRAELSPPDAARTLRTPQGAQRWREVERLSVGAKDNVGRFGALGFAALAAGLRHGGAPAPAEVEPVASAAMVWAGGHAGGDDYREALPELWRRLGSRVDFDLSPESLSRGRLLAIHTPYAAPLRALAADPARSDLLDEAESAASVLISAGAFLHDGGPAEVRGDPISAIADVGLFAEWLGALAFHRRDPSLRRLAASAERWRRTVAGEWRFGPRPRGWRWRRLDDGLEAALRRLDESGEPVWQAREDLGVWAIALRGDPHDHLDGLRRLPAVAEAAEQARHHEVSEIAVRLRRRRVPAAYVPALATLIRHGEL